VVSQFGNRLKGEAMAAVMVAYARHRQA
jgi:hypothetical protein